MTININIGKCVSRYSFSNATKWMNKNWKWIVVKPVLILYCFQFAITQSITSQVRYISSIIKESTSNIKNENHLTKCIALILVVARENLPGRLRT